MIKGIRDNEKFIKMMVKKPIFFKQPLRDSTNYDLSCVDFGNPKHILALLNNYNSFKQNTYEDLNSDLKYIMIDLEELIKRTDLKDFEKDIIQLKVDGCKSDEILAYLGKRYDIKWNDTYLSRVYNSFIPIKISEQYKKEFMYWYYLNIVKGEYKRCPVCGKIKLVNEFGKDSSKKDGLRSECRYCR
jgi:hypothetical protein